MNLFGLIKPKFVVSHFAFWLAVWFFYMYFFGYNSNNTVYVKWFSSFLLPVTMLITYFVVYFLIPRYLLTKKYFWFVLYSAYTLVISTYLIVITLFGSFIFFSNMKITNTPLMSRNYISVLILVYLIVFLVSLISLLNHNFKSVTLNKELQNRILETELELKKQELSSLKKQIHPHFLFNTLNTIYGFALKKSEQTPEMILKLSNLLDYILYQVNKPVVSLRDEVLHLKEYIALEEIRFHDTLDLQFKCDEIGEEWQIAPMLLIPYIENAFKHGVLIKGKLAININLKLEAERLIFKVINNALNQENEKNKQGIGLRNSQKRLDLHYPDNYDLNIRHQENTYEVELIIFDLNKF